MIPDSPFCNYVVEMLTACNSFIKVVKSLTLLMKIWILPRLPEADRPTGNNVSKYVSSTIVSCFKPSADTFLAKHKLKHLVVQLLDEVHYVSDRSFRSRVGVPLVCGKTVLARCIVQDAHVKLGHGRDVLQLLHNILSEFYIPGVKKLVVQMKKSCPGCTRLNRKPFSTFEDDMPDLVRTIQPPFSYCQADIFGPVLAYTNGNPMKRWVLVNLCLTSRAVHLELLHSYSAVSITRGFRRTFALRGIPRIIWIDAGLNIVKAGKDLSQTEVKVISDLNIKFASIEFRATLPKHHEGIGAVERVIGIIKNTASKAVIGPNQLKMDDEELHTYMNMVTEKVNDRPLILGAPQGITITPNHVLLGFRDSHREEVDLDVPVQRQLVRWQTCLKIFYSLWIQELTRRRFNVVWKNQTQVPKVGDIILFKNEAIYKHDLSAAKITQLLKRKNGDIYGATIEYRREIGGRTISVNRHLHNIFPFMDVETTVPEEVVTGLQPDDAVGLTAPGSSRSDVQDEIVSD